MRETGKSGFQRKVIKRLRREFVGCYILKNDSSYLPGVPDLIVLFEDRWAMLEVKGSATADEQPNQPWYVADLDGMSFAAFIYPENEEEVFRGLQRTFRSARYPRFRKRQQVPLD